MPYKQNQSRITITLDGKNLGVWDNRTGGDQDSNSSQWFLGGMGPRVTLGGTIQVDNVIIQVLQANSPQAGGAQLLANEKFIMSRCGKGEITYQDVDLDDEGNPFGVPRGFTGGLKRAKSSDIQSQGNDAKLFEIEVEVNGEWY